MGPTGGLNEELMRIIGRRLGQQPSYDKVEMFPLGKPDWVVAYFREELYPDAVSEAWFECRIQLNDDINMIYIEEWAGERWTCRWDRHDNDHNAREHFHPPPVVSTQTAIDIDLPLDPNRAVTVVLQFIEDRIRDLWQTAEPDYPSEYEFDREYGPDIWLESN